MTLPRKKPYYRKLTEEQKRVANARLATGVVLGKHKGIYESSSENTRNSEKRHEYTPTSNEELVDDKFDVESDELLIDCGIVFVLHAEYDVLSEVSEADDDFFLK